MNRRGLITCPLSVAVVMLLIVPAQASAVPTAMPPGVGAAKATPPERVEGPHVQGRRTEPVYDYAKAVRESVRVQTDMDSDKDGRKDTIMVDIVRPREAVEKGIKVPVIMLASPYFTTSGRGPENEKKTFDPAGNLVKMPLYYDNYFVPRGYAVASVDLLGTSRSTGCGDHGGPNEIKGVTSVIDWMNGRAKGTSVDGRNADATTWSTGNVGMIGKSYDGTVANGAAATGVEGLKTIVPIAAISSWYDYTRYNGIVKERNYPGTLARLVGNNNKACASQFAAMDRVADDRTGNDNEFWKARNYVKDANRVTASVLHVHGQSDLNVTTQQAGQWWDALAKNRVPQRMWFSRMEHTDPFDARREEWVNLERAWFDHWLQGIDNDVMTTRGEAETSFGDWARNTSWPVGSVSTLGLGKGTLGSPGTGTVRITDRRFTSESDIVANPTSPTTGRSTFLSEPMAKDVRVSGEPKVKLRIKADKKNTMMSARLVDYSSAQRYSANVQTSGESCWGGSTQADDGCYANRGGRSKLTDFGVFGRGYLDAAHREGNDHQVALPVGQWVNVTIPVMATDTVVKKGARLGLVVTLTDASISNTVPGSGASVDIDVAKSTVEMPGDLAAPVRPAVPGTSVTTPRLPDAVVQPRPGGLVPGTL